MRFAIPLTFLLFLSVFVRGSAPIPARAEATTTLRFATLLPPGSPYNDLLRAWNRSLKKATDNRVQLRFYTGGSQGDERDFIRKMRVGQMDAAVLSTVGLGMLVRPVLVLALPGLIENYDQLDRVRQTLDDRFAELFRRNGFELLTWADAGKARLFSAHKFAAPSDLKSLRPWAWKDDPISAHFFKVIGANPVRLGLNEVYAGLQTRMVDTVPVSAVGAIALQWFTKLKYMAKQSFGIIVGAILVEQKKFEALSKEDQQALHETANKMTKAFQPLVRRDDERAYQSLLKRGLVEIDLHPHKAAWDNAASQTRTQLTGRVYSKSLLQEVERAVQGK
jgi:TRAP-type C4-dicarboxylate transport system substrate-binding protein